MRGVSKDLDQLQYCELSLMGNSDLSSEDQNANRNEDSKVRLRRYWFQKKELHWQLNLIPFVLPVVENLSTFFSHLETL